MKALDTNILIRFLVKDDELQAKAVYKLFKQAESKAETFFITILVVLETIWVLEAVYDVSRQEIIDSIDELLLMPILAFEAQSAVRRFISSARENKTDLSDLLIAQHVKNSGAGPVITFDKRAAKLDLLELVK